MRWSRKRSESAEHADAHAARSAIAGLRRQKRSLDRYEDKPDTNRWAETQKTIYLTGGQGGTP